MKKLSDLLEIIAKSGYLHAKLNDKLISQINFLPLGSILLENIRKEWNKNKSSINTYFAYNTNSKTPLCISSLNEHKRNPFDFYKTDKFRENIQHVKNNFQKELPLAIKEEIKFEDSNKENLIEIDDELHIDLNQGTLLLLNYFFNESIATEQFYKIQRERKIWWMKFSSDPGRYVLSDLKTNLHNSYKIHQVNIKSKFDFGNLNLENIEMIPIRALQLEQQSEFRLKDIRLNKNIIPAVIKTEICLETAALNFLIDSIENTKFEKISIHRKIAPYQCSLFCLAKDEKTLLELEELASHLTNVIRKSGITVLNLQKCYTNNEKHLQKELNQMDKIGVPYSIILETFSLENGLMKLRNRDTTISELIHITDVPEYLIKIFNS